jgi:hypothetical protein
MSMYGLIKATSGIQRADTITDLSSLNIWLYWKGKKPILSYGQSVRALENSVALGLERIDEIDDLPKMVRGRDFYLGCVSEIKDSERKKWIAKNNVC